MKQEGYDSQEGFVSAGFAAEYDGGIHLAGAKGGMLQRLARKWNFFVKGGEAGTGKWEN